MAAEFHLSRPFWKMHGAGNDFVLWLDSEATFSADAALLSRLAQRPGGVGCDGFIVLQPSARADFRMRFFNPDGREAALCGNGLRCAARLAYDSGWAGRRMTVETGAGTLRAAVEKEGVRVEMPPVSDCRFSNRLTVGDRDWVYAFVNSGVPHAVLAAEDLDAMPVPMLGQAIRAHAAFAPEGTNVDFFAPRPSGIAMRTYERGVEGETLACGTGAVAVAVTVVHLGLTRPPVRILTRGGAELEVDFHATPQGAQNISLRGPAEYVFEGRLDTVP